MVNYNFVDVSYIPKTFQRISKNTFAMAFILNFYEKLFYLKHLQLQYYLYLKILLI